MKRLLIGLGFSMLLSWSQAQEITLRISQLVLDQWPQVTLYLSVLNAQQNPITDIESIQVLENATSMTLEDPGVQDAHGSTSFLLIDVSGSMQGSKLEQAKQAAKSFIKMKRPQDKVGLYVFSSGPAGWQKVVSPTDNEELLMTYLNQLRAEGKTEFFFAIAKTFNEIETFKGRRSLITLTDGRDTTDWHNPERKWDIIKRVAQAKIPIYTIGLGNDVERSDLTRIAEDTNGNFQFSPTESDLVSVFKQKAAQISGEYVLRYTSPDTTESGTARQVEVHFTYKGKAYKVTTSYLSGGLIPKTAKAQSQKEAAQKSANHLSIFLTITAILIFLGSLPPLGKMLTKKPVTSAGKLDIQGISGKKEVAGLSKDDIQGISRIKIQEPSSTPSRVKLNVPNESPAQNKPRIKLDPPS